MKELINYLDGKKTAIGGFILFIAAMPHIDEITSKAIVDILTYIGQGFVGFGLMHKGVKAVNEN
jgi:acyl CoA:acetate/3-ketoacid CoA transferase alpha subunit